MLVVPGSLLWRVSGCHRREPEVCVEAGWAAVFTRPMGEGMLARSLLPRQVKGHRGLGGVARTSSHAAQTSSSSVRIIMISSKVLPLSC